MPQVLGECGEGGNKVLLSADTSSLTAPDTPMRVTGPTSVEGDLVVGTSFRLRSVDESPSSAPLVEVDAATGSMAAKMDLVIAPDARFTGDPHALHG